MSFCRFKGEKSGLHDVQKKVVCHVIIFYHLSYKAEKLLHKAYKQTFCTCCAVVVVWLLLIGLKKGFYDGTRETSAKIAEKNST